MKYLILFLITFNIYASERTIITDLRNNSEQGNEIFETRELAMARLVKMGKLGKKNWRAGEFTNVLTNSLYSKEFNVINETGEVIGVETKYYHPVNWSYSFTDVTQELADAQAIVDAEKEERRQLKLMKNSINNSDLPSWHKRILKMYIKGLRND